MRCPKCGKVYPANVKNCTNHNCKQELLISESEYNRRFYSVTHKTYKDLANDYIRNKEFTKQKNRETNMPKCPTCGSTNIRHISSTERGVNAVMFGFFGNKRKCQFECMNPNCRYRW